MKNMLIEREAEGDMEEADEEEILKVGFRKEDAFC